MARASQAVVIQDTESRSPECFNKYVAEFNAWGEIPMNLRNWSKSKADYGRRLVHSGIAGVRSASQEFLDEESLAPRLVESVRSALAPAVVGACIGALGGGSVPRQKSVGRALVFGLLGGAIGLGAGLAWESRRLTASAVGGALRNIGRVRDEQWLVKHPINYA